MHIHIGNLRSKSLSISKRKRVAALKRYSQKQVRRALLNAKASLEIEGYLFTPQEDQLLWERADGELKYSEFLARAKEIAKNV